MVHVTDTMHEAVSADAFDIEAGRRFLEEGFCRVDEAIDDDELRRLREIYDWCFSGDADGKVKRKALGGTDEQGRQALPQVLGPGEVLPELRELTYYKRMERIARTVFQEEVERRSEHMILKPAGYGIATPWHQDQAYHDPTKHYRNINFWHSRFVDRVGWLELRAVFHSGRRKSCSQMLYPRIWPRVR